MLYHVSEKPGLKVLRPHASSHGRAYVYAVDDLVTGLLFGAGHDDFDLYLSNDAASPRSGSAGPARSRRSTRENAAPSTRWTKRASSGA